MAKAATNKQVQFTQARRRLSTIIDEVQKPSKSVTIVRHGKPAAVIISHEEFQFLRDRASRKKKWKLAGSLKLPAALDIDELLERAKRERIRIVKQNIRRLARELNES